jgi:murein DD-endopeptidase MepM/ murein hydrolase activator NlpD
LLNLFHEVVSKSLTHTEPNTVWSDILQIQGDPLIGDLDNRVFRGFGNGDGLQGSYPLVADCSHPGLDFFPDVPGNVQVKAVADGIVVGIGLFGDGHRATLWGAVVSGGCNLIIRTGGHFVLYGDLQSAEPHLYLGARVFTGEVVATLAEQGMSGDNTHLHLEVDAYSSGQNVSCQLLQRFGAVRHGAGTENPSLVIDPMYFITDKGDFVSTGSAIDNSSCANTLKTNYTVSRYDDASINGKSFDYNVRTDVYLKGFNKTTGAIPDAENCLTDEPGECVL